MDHLTQYFKLYFVNCRSISNKLGEIKTLIYQNKPHVFCFNETWLNRFVPKINNYVSVWENRVGPGGGLGISVSSEVAHKMLQLNLYPGGFLEVQAVGVILENGHQLNILNIYNPNKSVTVNEFDHYISQLGDKYLVVGDFNAHTPILDTNCRRSNFTGRSLEGIILDGSSCLVNPTDLFTYTNPGTGLGSCLDLCLASPSLAALVDIQKGPDVGSDHLTMIVSLHIGPKKITTVGVRKFIDNDQQEIENFASQIKESCLVLPNSLDTVVSDFTERLLESAETNVSRTSGKARQYKSTPWWNKDIGKLVAKRRKARRLLERHPVDDNLKDYNSCTTAAREMCDASKKKSLHEYVSSLQYNTPVKTAWKKWKAFRGGYTPTVYPIENNGLITDPKEKANLLADHFASNAVSSPRTIPVDLENTIFIAKMAGSDKDYNQSITYQELEDSLAKPRKTAAGADQIPYFLLRGLKEESKMELLRIFNQSFATGQVPSMWKIGTVIPILKPEKDSKLVESYRPITLLSCTSKLLERIIQNRLEYVIENGNYLKPEQCGFRRGLGTPDVLLRIETEIRKALDSKEICLVVHVDLKSAFDKVWGQGLIYKLAKLGLQGNMLRWFENYLQNRKIQVRLQGHFSDEKDIIAGTPQGAVCSPTLFNLMLSDIPDSMGIKKYIFADDITVLCSGSDVTEVGNRLQRYLDNFVQWASDWGMVLSPTKTVLQIFTRRKIIPPNIHLDGNLLQYEKEKKLLGLIFDAPILTWRAHVEYLRSRCIKKINMLKSLASPKWGASSKILKIFYTGFIRSQIDYGSCIYATAAASHLNKIEPMQNAGLRLILGARKSSPALSLQAESGLPPLEIRRMYLIMREYIKLMYRPYGDVTTNLLDLNQGIERCDHVPEKSFLWSVRSTLNTLDMTVARTPTSNRAMVPLWQSTYDFSSVAPYTAIKDPVEFENHVEEHYGNYQKIYTDGSRIVEPSISVACAIYLPHLEQVQCWKLDPEHSIVFAELFALYQALRFIEISSSLNDWIIFSDSLCSLFMIRGHLSSYSNMVSIIQHDLITLNKNRSVIVHWVKSHVGIHGNEVVDRAANHGHQNALITPTAICKEEKYSSLTAKLGQYWDSFWKTSARQTGKGLFLTNVRENIYQNVPYNIVNRRLETAIYRLRIGHAGLNEYLHRIKIVESDECDECQVPETVEHFLFHCNKYLRQRFLMTARLRYVDENIIEPSLKLILGGSVEYYNKRRQILKILSKYLKSTGKLENL